MKISLLSLVALLVAPLAHAESRALQCKGYGGGPGPAEAVVTLDPADKDFLHVQVTLKNPSFPEGVTGAFVGTKDLDARRIYAQGILAGVKVGLAAYAHASYTGRTYLLGLYADADRRIEFGYGQWFSCR